MATTSVITGRILLPDNTAPIDGILRLVLSGVDTDAGEVIAQAAQDWALETDGDLPSGLEVYNNSEGIRATFYRAYLLHSVADPFGAASEQREVYLGVFQLGDTDTTANIQALLDRGVTEAIGTFWTAISESDAEAVLDAASNSAADALASAGVATAQAGLAAGSAGDAAASAATALAAIDGTFLPVARPAWVAAFSDGQPLPPGLTFARSTPTTRRNRNGLLEVVPAGMPAHHYNAAGAYQGIGIFMAANQLIPTVAINGSSGVGVVNGANAALSVTGPDGVANSASKVTRAAASTATLMRVNDMTVTAEGHCFSAFVKEDGVSWVALGFRIGGALVGRAFFNIGTGAAGTNTVAGSRAGIEPWADGWYRIWLAVDVAASADCDFQLDLAEGNNDTVFATGAAGTEGVQFFGLNLTTSDMPLPLFLSAGAISLDQVVTTTAIAGFNVNRGVFYAEVTPAGFNLPSDSGESGNGIISAYSGTVLQGTFLQLSSTGLVGMTQRTGAANVSDSTASAATAMQATRVAGGWGPSGYLASRPGDAGAYTGSKVASVVSDGSIWLGLWVSAGSQSANAALNGWMKVAACWPVDLSAPDIHALTAYGLDLSAAAVTAPMIQPRHHFVDVADYVPQNDTLDCWDGIQAAMIAAEGRALRFTNPLRGSRTYRLTNRAKGSLVGLRRGVIEWDNSAFVDFSGWSLTGLGAGGTGTSWCKSEGIFAASVVASPVSPATVIEAKQNRITVASATGFVRGTRFILNTTEQYTPMEGSIGDIGEWCMVESVSGTTLTLATDLRHSYDPALGTIKAHRAVDLVNLRLNNPQIIGPGILAGALVSGSGPRGDRGYEVINADSFLADGGTLTDSDLYQFMLTNVREVRIRDTSFVKTQAQPASDSRQRYHVGYAGVSQFGLFTGGSYIGGTEQISPTTTGGGTSVSPEEIQGLKDTIIVQGNLFRGAWRSGVGTHHAYVDLQIENNKFFSCNQAADMRLGGRFWNNHVSQTNIPAGAAGLDCAVQLGAGLINLDAGCNVFEDVFRGYWMQPSTVHWRPVGDVTIQGDVMRGVRQAGVLLEYNGDGAGGLVSSDLGSLTVKADIHLATSGTAGVLARGRWSNVDIDLKVTGGPASGARAVTLTRAAGSASSTDGPRDPIVKVRRTANIATPLINFPVNGGGSVAVTDDVFGVP